MEGWVLISRLFLAGVFGLAGLAKLNDMDGSERAFESFGFPTALVRPGVLVISLVELAIAALLLFPAVSWYAAVASLILLAVFTTQIVYQLARGNAPECHCFGQVSSEPVGVQSVFRNLIFAAAAAFLLYRGPSGQGPSLADPSVDPLVLVIALGVAVIFLNLRQIATRQNELGERLDEIEAFTSRGAVEREDVSHPNEGLPIGSVVPDFSLPNLLGETVTLADLKAGSLPVLFFFLSPNCTPCRSLVGEFAEWNKRLAGRLKMVFVSTGTAADNVDKFGDRFAETFVLQEARELADPMKAQWTPTAILMDAGGRIASHTAAGDAAIRHLVEHIAAEDLTRELTFFTNGHTASQTTRVGQRVPEFSLEAIDGKVLTDAELRGRQTLVAFWSLNCSYCDAMLDELREWDRQRGADDPALVVFSDGDRGANASLELTSPVVIDADLAGKLGMFGTPSAILVNRDGVIMSETAMGAADIWSLIGKQK